VTPRTGERFLVLRPLRCHVGISWAAPYSTGHGGLVPAGELIECGAELAEGATAVLFTPVRYKELEPWLVGTADPLMRKYQGYGLAVDLDQLQACCRPAPGEEAVARDYESPVVHESEGVQVTGTAVVAEDRRYFLEGLESIEVREVRGSRKLASYLLLFGVILLTVIVGIAFIAAAVAVYLHRRYDVVVRYAGAEERIARHAKREEAQALAEAISGRLPGVR
jgi:hypothetical protein